MNICNCWSCGNAFSPSSKGDGEHIIPNSLGGKLKSRNILCTNCNQYYGNSIDKDISEQLGFITIKWGFSQDREKDTYIIGRTSNGTSLHFYKGLEQGYTINIEHPILKKPITINHRDRTIVLKKAKEKLNQLYKNDPERLNIMHQKLINQPFETLPAETFHFSNNRDETLPLSVSKIGGRDFDRAIAKIALNYFAHIGGNRAHALEVINFVKKSYEPNPNFYVRRIYEVYYVPHVRLPNEIAHIISIQGMPEKGLLLAYVELFSFECYIIRLNKDYSGPEIDNTYCYDLLTKKITNKKVILGWNRAFINRLYTTQIEFCSAYQNEYKILTDRFHVIALDIDNLKKYNPDV